MTSGLVLRTDVMHMNGGADVRWLHLLVDAAHVAMHDATADDAATTGAGVGVAAEASGGSRKGGDPRLVQGWREEDVVYVELRDQWLYTPVRPGDRLNLVGELVRCPCGGARHRSCTVLSRDAGPLLVLRPEVLVTGTQLAQTCSCARRVALGRGRAGNDLGEKLVLGTMKHELLETALNTWTRERTDAEACSEGARGGGAAGGGNGGRRQQRQRRQQRRRRRRRRWWRRQRWRRWRRRRVGGRRARAMVRHLPDPSRCASTQPRSPPSYATTCRRSASGPRPISRPRARRAAARGGPRWPPAARRAPRGL